jgi:hypothetical protein
MSKKQGSNQALAEPGPTTTEFWVSALTSLSSVVLAVVQLFQSDFNPTWVESIIPAVAMIAAAITASVYTHSRSKVKIAAHQAASMTPQSVANHADAGASLPATPTNGASPVALPSYVLPYSPLGAKS